MTDPRGRPGGQRIDPLGAKRSDPGEMIDAMRDPLGARKRKPHPLRHPDETRATEPTREKAVAAPEEVEAEAGIKKEREAETGKNEETEENATDVTGRFCTHMLL